MILAIALVIGILAIAVAVGTVWVMKRRGPSEGKDMTGDEMFMLGVIFLGAGIALFVSVGPAMLGMVGLGAVFMALGARKRQE